MPQILEYGILLNKPALALQEAEVVTFAVTNTLLGSSAIWTCCRHRGALRVRLGLCGAALRAPVPGPWAGRLPPRLCCLQPLQRGVCACCHLVSMDSDAHWDNWDCTAGGIFCLQGGRLADYGSKTLQNSTLRNLEGKCEDF